MSRRPKNLGLRQLLARKSKEWGEDACVLDMACTLTTSRRAIHLYTTGRRRFPLLEARMAEFFGVSVRTLRRKLGLPGATAAISQSQTPNQGAHHDSPSIPSRLDDPRHAG
jgi:hypothetical protein